MVHKILMFAVTFSLAIATIPVFAQNDALDKAEQARRKDELRKLNDPRLNNMRKVFERSVPDHQKGLAETN